MRDLIIFFEDIHQSFYLEQDGNDEERRRLLRDIVRRMHNFVASVLSLIDHSRLHYRRLYDRNNIFPEYQPKVDEVFKFDPLACFVKDLRQYFQHYGLPGIYFQRHWTSASGLMERTVRLRLTDLEQFTWSGTAKKFLADQNEDINLLTLTDAYHDKVTTFYNWFQGRQEELHADAFRKVTDAKRDMRRLALPDILNATLHFPNLTAQQFEASILNFLDEDTRIVLALTEQNSKAELLCTVFKTMSDISPELEKQIRQLYL